MPYEYLIRTATVTVNGLMFPDNKTEIAVLNEMSRKGYRYVNSYPSACVGFGKLAAISFVFERYKEGRKNANSWSEHSHSE